VAFDARTRAPVLASPGAELRGPERCSPSSRPRRARRRRTRRRSGRLARRARCADELNRRARLAMEYPRRRLTDTAASSERAMIEMVQHARPGRHAVDLVGRAFGRLTVIARAGRGPSPRRAWIYSKDCRRSKCAENGGRAGLQPIDFPRLRGPWSNISLVGGWDPRSTRRRSPGARRRPSMPTCSSKKPLTECESGLWMGCRDRRRYVA
jgi:hypothetical protein